MRVYVWECKRFRETRGEKKEEEENAFKCQENGKENSGTTSGIFERL